MSNRVRIALISDLHGNEAALRTVLNDADELGVDRVVCLGDVATLGPRPREVLGLLKDLGCSCILGNHDDFLLTPGLVQRYTQAPIVIESVEWCNAELGAADRAFLATFKATEQIELAPGVSLSLFHGTPRSHMEDLIAETPPDAVDVMLAGQRALLMAGGHTHIQMVRQHRGALLVNPGSVGMPFREYVSGRAPVVLPHAEYALVEAERGNVSVTLRRVEVQRTALRQALKGSKLPLAPMLLEQYGN